MELPNVGIIVITWNRFEEIQICIDSMLKFFSYAGKVKWILADDRTKGSDAYARSIAEKYPDLRFFLSVTDKENSGWGHNVNTAMLEGMRRYNLRHFFTIEDDYFARRRIDITPAVALIESAPHIGRVRMDGLSGHSGLNLTVKEQMTPLGMVDYMRINPSQSGHWNVYSNRSAVTHVRFHLGNSPTDISDLSYSDLQKPVNGGFGLFPTNRDLGSMELAFDRRVRQVQGPEIVCLADGIERYTVHMETVSDKLGKSWKGGPHDRAGKG
jgi:hypothetical protein